MRHLIFEHDGCNEISRLNNVAVITHSELSQIYNYIEPLCLDIAHEVIRWQRTHGKPADEAKYLLEVSSRLCDNLLSENHFPP